MMTTFETNLERRVRAYRAQELFDEIERQQARTDAAIEAWKQACKDAMFQRRAPVYAPRVERRPRASHRPAARPWTQAIRAFRGPT